MTSVASCGRETIEKERAVQVRAKGSSKERSAGNAAVALADGEQKTCYWLHHCNYSGRKASCLEASQLTRLENRP